MLNIRQGARGAGCERIPFAKHLRDLVTPRVGVTRDWER